MKEIKQIFLYLVFLFFIGLFIGGFPLAFEILEFVLKFISFLFSLVFKILPIIPKDEFDLIKKILENSWSLTKIKWLDKALFFVATLAPSAATYILGNLGLKLNKKGSCAISIIVFVLTLYLFKLIWFWVFLGLIIFIVVTSILRNQKI